MTKVIDMGTLAPDVLEAIRKGDSVEIQTVCDKGFVKTELLTPYDFFSAGGCHYALGDDGYVTDEAYKQLKEKGEEYCTVVGAEVKHNDEKGPPPFAGFKPMGDEFEIDGKIEVKCEVKKTVDSTS